LQHGRQTSMKQEPGIFPLFGEGESDRGLYP